MMMKNKKLKVDLNQDQGPDLERRVREVIEDTHHQEDHLEVDLIQEENHQGREVEVIINIVESIEVDLEVIQMIDIRRSRDSYHLI
jgi:hypothetical protein